MVISNSAVQHFEWKNFGLRIHTTELSLPEGIEQCSIRIVASIAGHYKFPESSHLVSGVFWFQCNPSCKFVKPIIIEIQHCAKQENTANLNFVKAVCDQKMLPYTFEHVQSGHFNCLSSYGVLDLNSFSGVGITQEGTAEREYCAKLYYIFTPHLPQPQRHQLEVHLVVTWNTEMHIQVCHIP